MTDKASFRLELPWEQVRERIKEAEISLTDEDLQYQPGQEQQLLDRLSIKLHKSPENVKGWIESLSANKPLAG